MKQPFLLPHEVLQMIAPSAVGRKQRLFKDCTNSVKRRKTAEIRHNNSTDSLTFASSMKLRLEGKSSEAKLVQLATQTTPQRASRILSAWEKSEALIIPYTADEALALILDLRLTKAQYNKLRGESKKRNADLYPSYKKILLAKKNCYPPSDSTVISELEMKIQLQNLLDHTTTRIIQSRAASMISFTDDELQNVEIVFKYGFDGTTDLTEYKQPFVDDDGTLSDGNVFVSSIVPIRATTNGKIVYENQHPSSTKYCRPLHLQFKKETSELTVEEKNDIEDQIRNLQPVSVAINGRLVQARYKLLLTMVDGKVCSACASVKSTQKCYICNARPTEMNDVDKVMLRTVKDENFQFGLSTLHAYIRFFEYFLHLSYRLDFKKWSVRKESDKVMLKNRKEEIKKKFKLEMGLYVDKPRPGGRGNSNDGNTARRFFRHWEQSAKITGTDANLIYRCKIILEALVSGNCFNYSERL